MDNYNGKTNEDFIKYFLDQLYSKTEFIQYDDPDDLFDPEQEYGPHIVNSQEKLYEYITKEIKDTGNNLNDEEIRQLMIAKREEIFKVLMPKIEEYISIINVDYR
jgi:hypothetical protein